MRSASAASAGSWARTDSRACPAAATTVVASTPSGSSGFPASAVCAREAAEARASACPSRSASAASSVSSPGNGSTAATSFSPKRSRSASWARSRARVVSSSKVAATVRSRR